MTNPFDDDEAPYLVLVNADGQHSIWPVFAEVPVGWTEVFRGERKSEVLAYVEQNWIDMRPKTLIDAMAERSSRWR